MHCNGVEAEGENSADFGAAATAKYDAAALPMLPNLTPPLPMSPLTLTMK